jgi:two-component system NarL family sensor kinase
MRYLRLLFVLTLSAHQSFGQESIDDLVKSKIDLVKRQIDSLPMLISNREITGHKECLLKEHNRYQFRNQTTVFSPRVIHLSSTERPAFILMYAYNRAATDLYEAKNYSAADSCWHRALDISIANNFDCEELHMLRPALNNSCFLSGDYTRAMEISSAGFTKADSIHDLNRMAHFSNVIGYIHMKQKNFAESEKHFTRYLQLAIQMKDSFYEAHAFYNLGDLAVSMGNYDKALHLLQNSVDIYRAFFQSPRASYDLQDRESYVSNKMAEAWKLKGDFSKALSYAMVAVKAVAKPTSVNEYDKAGYLVNTADIYNRLRKPDSAVYFLHNALAIARRIIHRELIRDAYQQLSLAFAQKKLFDSAFFYGNLYAVLKDSVASESSQQEIFRHEAEMRIEKQRLVQEQAVARQKMWKNIVGSVAIFILVIVYLLYNRHRLKQKNKYQAAQNRQQQEILSTAISVQDQERKRIAADLHDGLGSILSATKLKLSALDEQMETQNGEKEKLRQSLELIDEAMAEMKNIAYNIMPATLSRLGLTAALQNLFNRISSKAGLEIDFTTYGFTERLDESTELSIYRIILESINNVVKHARASEVTVQLVKYADHINLTIEDNGNGFDPLNENSFGNGLNNISSRVRKLNGALDIDSNGGNGTTIVIDIPYQ